MKNLNNQFVLRDKKGVPVPQKKVINNEDSPIVRTEPLVGTKTYAIAFTGQSKSEEEEKKAESLQSLEGKTPVAIVSNSFHYKPKINVEEDQSRTISLTAFPGGLARGVNSAFGEDSSYGQLKWFATASEDVKIGEETVIADDQLKQEINDKLEESRSQLLFLPDAEQIEWYSSTNEVYWPMLHEMMQYVTDQDRTAIYEQVNATMADKIISTIKEDNNGEIPEEAIVWVQDYHFNSSIKHFKENEPDLKVGYFLHVPFPEINEQMQTQLEVHMPGIKESLTNLIKADSIGVHTEKDKNNFIQTLQNLQIISPEQLQEINDKVLVNPIGIPKMVVEDNYAKAMSKQAEVKLTFDDKTEDRQIRHDEKADGPISEGWVNVKGKLDPLEILSESAKGWTKGKEAFAVGSMEFKKDKINIGSLSRTDYTKGTHQLMKGFRDFLREKVAEGIENPGEKYQLNVISSAPRELDTQEQYEQDALTIAREVLAEFPESLNYVRGVDYDQLPIFFAAQQVIAATSTKDGYILAVGEGLIAKTKAAKELMLPPELVPSALIVSTGAGIAESLGKTPDGVAQTAAELPAALSLIEPTVEGVKNALVEQISRIETQMALPAAQQDMGGFYELEDRLENTEGFGIKALDHVVEMAAKAKQNQDTKPAAVERAAPAAAPAPGDFSALGATTQSTAASRIRSAAAPATRQPSRKRSKPSFG